MKIYMLLFTIGLASTSALAERIPFRCTEVNVVDNQGQVDLQREQQILSTPENSALFQGLKVKLKQSGYIFGETTQRRPHNAAPAPLFNLVKTTNTSQIEFILAGAENIGKSSSSNYLFQGGLLLQRWTAKVVPRNLDTLKPHDVSLTVVDLTSLSETKTLSVLLLNERTGFTTSWHSTRVLAECTYVEAN